MFPSTGGIQRDKRTQKFGSRTTATRTSGYGTFSVGTGGYGTSSLERRRAVMWCRPPPDLYLGALVYVSPTTYTHLQPTPPVRLNVSAGYACLRVCL